MALILILAAVALPQGRKSVTFAKLSQTRANMLEMDAALRAHFADWGSVPADANDPIQIQLAYRVRSVTEPVCSFNFDFAFATDGGLQFVAGRRDYYANDIHCPLTTPVAYISHIQTLDPFSDGTVPFGYDSRYIQNEIAYGGFFSAGPDLVAGDWISRVPYCPTNGSTSRGEFWSLVSDCEAGSDPLNPCVADTDGYPTRTVFPPPTADLNGDNRMNAEDLFVFLSDWQKSSASSRK